jgi:hypothetical protein
VLAVAVDPDSPGHPQVLACLSHGAGERYLAVRARDGEQPPDLMPGAYRRRGHLLDVMT